MNMRDMPGPGDYDRFPITSPNDPRCDDDELCAEEAMEAIAEHVFDERMASVDCVSEAFSSLTDAEYKAIDEALVLAINSTSIATAVNLSSTIIAAVRRELKEGAKKEARIRFDRMRREDEADAAAARMGH